MNHSIQFDLKAFEKAVIKCLLDELCVLTQSDSSWILPDMPFASELEIQPEQVVAISRSIYERLGLTDKMHRTLELYSAQTPKQLVEMILQQQQSESSLAA